MEHSIKILCTQLYTVTAYCVYVNSESAYKNRPELAIHQENIAEVYSCDNPNGFIVQKSHSAIGKLGAAFIPPADGKQLLECKDQVLDLVKSWNAVPHVWYPDLGLDGEIKYILIGTYHPAPTRTYELWSSEMFSGFGKALAATGIGNRYTNGVMKDKPMHAAEQVQLDDLTNITPTTWVVVM